MQRGRGEKHVLLLYLKKKQNICCLPAAAMRSIELHNEIFLIRSPFLKIADSVVQKTMLSENWFSENLRNYGRGKKHICYLPGKKHRTFFYLPIYLPTCCHEKRGVWQWDLLQQSWSFHGGCPDVSSWSTAIDSSSHISATLQQQCTIKSFNFPIIPVGNLT